MRHLIRPVLFCIPLLTPLAALASGDAANGESEFRACRACHTIESSSEVIVRGGKTGPNLFGVIGRTAGTEEGVRYGKDMEAAGEAGLVWTEDEIAKYLQNPRDYLGDFLDKPSAKTTMPVQRVKHPEDVAAYLATFAAPE